MIKVINFVFLFLIFWSPSALANAGEFDCKHAPLKPSNFFNTAVSDEEFPLASEDEYSLVLDSLFIQLKDAVSFAETDQSLAIVEFSDLFNSLNGIPSHFIKPCFRPFILKFISKISNPRLYPQTANEGKLLYYNGLIILEGHKVYMKLFLDEDDLIWEKEIVALAEKQQLNGHTTEEYGKKLYKDSFKIDEKITSFTAELRSPCTGEPKTFTTSAEVLVIPERDLETLYSVLRSQNFEPLQLDLIVALGGVDLRNVSQRRHCKLATDLKKIHFSLLLEYPEIVHHRINGESIVISISEAIELLRTGA